MIHQPDDMEAISHDARLGEVFAHDRAVNGRQIHADHLHQMLAFEAVEIAFQRQFAAAEHHIVDFVVLQIAEGGGVSRAVG